MASLPSPSPASRRATQGPTYAEVIAEALTRCPDREALVLGDRRMSYAQTTDLVARIQHLLVARGITPGRGVGVLSPNAPEALAVQSATAAEVAGQVAAIRHVVDRGPSAAGHDLLELRTRAGASRPQVTDVDEQSVAWSQDTGVGTIDEKALRARYRSSEKRGIH